jgi:hypothetical protein
MLADLTVKHMGLPSRPGELESALEAKMLFRLPRWPWNQQHD